MILSMTGQSHMNRILLICVAFLLGILATPAAGQLPGIGQPRSQQEQEKKFHDSRDRVTVDVAISRERVAPGDELVVAVTFTMDSKWKIWAGDQPLPQEYFKTRILAAVEEGSGMTVHPGFIQWPQYKTIEFFGDDLPVYEGTVNVYLPVLVDEDAEPGEATMTIRPVFQVCDDRQCLAPTPLPPRQGQEPSEKWLEYGHEVPVTIVEASALTGDDRATSDEALFVDFDWKIIEDIRAGAVPEQIVEFWGVRLNIAGVIGFGLLLLIAGVGGFLLNLTPCVLPVIPIKIMSLAKQATNRRKCFSLGVAMGLGIIALWLAIGATIAVFGVFTSTNELFQHPPFAITVGIIIAAMAIAMCGLFSLQLPQWVYTINPGHDSYHGSFGFGIMTGILALPCTAPFMGAAIAASTIFPPSVSLTIFAAIGLGQAIPYIILAAFPQLADRIPRAGEGSELVKQVMGLLMLGAATFFVGIGFSGAFASPPEPPSRAYWWFVGAFVAVAGLWLAYRTVRITPVVGRRIAFCGLGILLVTSAVYGSVRLTDRGPIEWQYYTAEQLERSLESGQIVVMEFTAEWCINCKFLERTVLFTRPVLEALSSEDVVPIKVDLTGNNPGGNELLNQMGRRSIPLLVIIDPNGEQVLTEDWYTQGQVLRAIEKARGVRLARRDG